MNVYFRLRLIFESVGEKVLSVVKCMIFFFDYCLSVVISFSMMLRRLLNNRRSGPSALNISRRLLMSVLLNVFIAMVAIFGVLLGFDDFGFFCVDAVPDYFVA
jgi:uncharacterized membrane protein YhaH (DUF805 family)